MLRLSSVGTCIDMSLQPRFFLASVHAVGKERWCSAVSCTTTSPFDRSLSDSIFCHAAYCCHLRFLFVGFLLLLHLRFFLIICWEAHYRLVYCYNFILLSESYRKVVRVPTDIMASSFYYFAYGTYVDPAILRGAIGDGVSIIASRLAYLPGYTINCTAVSREGPRLGLANLKPIVKERRLEKDHEGSMAREAAGEADGRPKQLDSRLCESGVCGVVHELPASVLPCLLQRIAQEGSFNVGAKLPCYLLQRNGGAAAGEEWRWDSTPTEAFVVAALDVPLLQQRYNIDPAVLMAWNPLQPSSSPSQAEQHPLCHWCRCICSDRVAPSVSYASALRTAYRTHAYGQLKSGAAQSSAVSSAATAWEQTMEMAVYRHSRDVNTDPAERRVWYFAYGSNLSWEQVCLRIGPPYQRRAVQLGGYVLVANKVPLDRVKYASFGYYNVEPASERQAKIDAGVVPHVSTMPSFVCGAAYEISEAQLTMMDSFETGYHRELLRCISLDDPTSAIDCWVYLAAETSEELLPSKEYLGRVLEGSDILPPDYMEAIRATKTNSLRSPRQEQRLRKEL